MVTDQDYHDESNRAIEELIAERDKLKDALEEIKNIGIGDQMIYALEEMAGYGNLFRTSSNQRNPYHTAVDALTAWREIK